MTRFVALLRGINVGGSRKVPMAALRSALAGSGSADVRTYLQSGNVAFSATHGSAQKHAAAIEAVIEREFGFAVDTHVLPCETLAAIAAENPFLVAEPTADESSLHAAFLFGPPTAEKLAALERLAVEGERTALGEGVLYLQLPHGVGRSKLAAGLARLGVPTTARNWRTVRALVALCEADGG